MTYDSLVEKRRGRVSLPPLGTKVLCDMSQYTGKIPEEMQGKYLWEGHLHGKFECLDMSREFAEVLIEAGKEVFALEIPNRFVSVSKNG